MGELVFTTGEALTTGPAIPRGPTIWGPLYKPYRESMGRNREASYLVLNCPTEAACRIACGEQIPYYGADQIVVLYQPVIGAQILDYVEIVEQINDTTWRVTAHYKASDASTLPAPKVSFDTMGGAKHIVNSIQTKAAFPSTYGGISVPKVALIDYDIDAQMVRTSAPRGADISEAVFQWSESQYFSQDYVTQSYKNALANLTDHYNQATFRGYPIGEVLFLGATGSVNGKRTDQNAYWEIIFHFAQKPTRTSQTIGPITGVNAYGWDLIWPMRLPPFGPAGYQAIAAIIVEQVYYPGDFSILGIGS